MTMDDLASYRAISAPALVGSYRNRTIYTTHAPSGGPILLSLLNTIEPLTDYVEEGRTPLNMHRFVEAQKFSFARRTEFGDPAFVDNAHKWKEIVDKQFARDTLAQINDVRALFLLSRRRAELEWVVDDAHFRLVQASLRHPRGPRDDSHQRRRCEWRRLRSDLDGYAPLFALVLAQPIDRTVNIPFGAQVMCPETGIILKCALLSSLYQNVRSPRRAQ